MAELREFPDLRKEGSQCFRVLSLRHVLVDYLSYVMHALLSILTSTYCCNVQSGPALRRRCARDVWVSMMDREQL